MLDELSSPFTASAHTAGEAGATLSPLRAAWESSAAEPSAIPAVDAGYGTIAITFSAADDLSLTIYGAAAIDGGDVIARLQSSYVGYGDPLAWRAIHLPVASDGRAIALSPATRVRAFTPLGEKPELRFMVLDHLHELREMLARLLDADVAIDIR